jgi:hypothetical protein
MSAGALFWAMKQKPGNAAQKLLLICLANFADARGRAYPKQATLAEFALMSERTVRRGLDDLEALGFVRREERRRQDGTRRGDLYHLALPADIVPPGEDDDAESTGQNGRLSTGQNGRSQPANLAGQEPNTSETPTLSSLEPDGSRRAEAEGGQETAEAKLAPSSESIDWKAVVFNGDTVALADLAGCSQAKARSRVGRIAKDNGWPLKVLHEAIAETLKARPAGDPFLYVTNTLARLLNPAHGLAPGSIEAKRAEFGRGGYVP